MTEYLKIGFIQTNLDNDIAWGPRENITLRMKEEAENYIWQEMKKGFHKLYNHHTKPDIIVMPELTVPNGYQYELRKLAQEMNAVVIAGLDWDVNKEKKVKNNAILIVPNKWNEDMKSSSTTIRLLGKKYPANAEKKTINEYSTKDFTFDSDENMYLIDSGEYGKIGFAICADFYDIERYVAYKGKVQHMIIIAYNQDTNSFFSLAEGIARLVMCNVLICNTGKFGDSLVFSPYSDSYKRMIFRNQGADLFATQVVHLPVNELIQAQQKITSKVFKIPPGYKIE
ncbi:MAG: hypothetical protein PHN18_02950 [Sulfurospirillaceae bacterium]|nr:hypothetical protein [Sulfurospirillaceae bacterium]MDD2825635.1 hypothetical protein [Sulfurospirillaceae bacterium]